MIKLIAPALIVIVLFLVFSGNKHKVLTAADFSHSWSLSQELDHVKFLLIREHDDYYFIAKVEQGKQTFYNVEKTSITIEYPAEQRPGDVAPSLNLREPMVTVKASGN